MIVFAQKETLTNQNEDADFSTNHEWTKKDRHFTMHFGAVFSFLLITLLRI